MLQMAVSSVWSRDPSEKMRMFQEAREMPAAVWAVMEEAARNTNKRINNVFRDSLITRFEFS